MQYRKGYSLLGYGCMRLPSSDDKAEELVMHAYKNGINYYDTAYIYKGKEEQLGYILDKNGIRDKVQIATKLPVNFIKKPEEFDKIFDEELRRLKTDYVDNYLMHMLPDVVTWNRLCDMGIKEWLTKKKESGQIKHVGFSFHGSTEQFLKLLDVYDWEFCQVQYNYLDEHSQAGRVGVEEANKRGIPVIIMEPLRGGRLVQGLNKKAKAVIAKTDLSAAQWGLKWLYSQESISCVLSGMGEMDMLEENIEFSSRDHTFREEDFKTIEDIKKAMQGSKNIPCTGCRYCMPCPFGVDIPGCFSCYNVSYTDGFVTGQREYIMAETLREEQTFASLCKKCGKCEKNCPQQIPIRDELKRVRRRLEGPAFQVAKIYTNKIYRKAARTKK